MHTFMSLEGRQTQGHEVSALLQSCDGQLQVALHVNLFLYPYR